MRPRHRIQLRKGSRQPSIPSDACAAGCGDSGFSLGLGFGVDSAAADLGELVTNVCPGHLRFFGVQTWFEADIKSARSSAMGSTIGRWTELARQPAARGCSLDGVTFGAMCFARGGGSRSAQPARKAVALGGHADGTEKPGHGMRGAGRLGRARTGSPDDEMQDLAAAASTLRAALYE